MTDMEPKIILITGASSGSGYEAARLLARKGHKVYGAARRVEKIEELSSEGVIPLKMDVTDTASMKSGVDRIIAEQGHIDVLVNNAGYGYFGAIETVPLEDARRQLEVNVFGLAELCRLVLPSMRERRCGRIVNIASVAGRSVMYFGGWYHVSKYSVEALSDALRMEVKPFGIDVSIIEPGAIRTDWGIIAARHLAESSRGTEYEKDAAKEAATMHKWYSSKAFTNPDRVAAAICRAALSKRPSTRYRLGFGAGSLIFLHWLLPTRWWDAQMRNFLTSGI